MTDKGCLSCAVVSGRSDTLGGTILETDLFHLHQDVAYPIEGLVIVALKRHVFCLDELSEIEAVELQQAGGQVLECLLPMTNAEKKQCNTYSERKLASMLHQ